MSFRMTDLKSLGRAFGLALVLVCFAMSPAGAETASKPLTVLELFTSQGCSSCPPADAYLGELAEREDILALALHVDYWDYIGWKDPFASPEYTTRQRDYATNFGMRYVYTPQMVIQGMTHATGSSRREIEKTIKDMQGARRIEVKLDRMDKGLRVTVPEADTESDAAVWLVIFDKKHETEVKRGENAGQKLADYNVVRRMLRIGTWSGGNLEIPVTAVEMSADGRDGCAVLVQSLRNGRILGAAKLDL